MHCRPPISILVLLSVLLLATPMARAGDPDVKRAVAVLKRFAKEPFEQKQRAAALRDLGRIGGADAAAALLPVFTDPFVHLRDHAVSAWIAMVKGPRAEETVEWLGTKGLKHRNEEVRVGVATALGFAEGAAAGEHLRTRLYKERSATVLAALLRAWARTEARTPSGLVDLLRHKEGQVVLAVAEALAARGALRSTPPGIYERLRTHRHALGRAGGVVLDAGVGLLDETRALAVLEDAAVEPRIVLAQILARDVDGLPWEDGGRRIAERLLADPSWRVRAAMIQGALRRWRADVVPLLVERLPEEEGRLRLDLAHALATLTGKNLGPDVDLWRSWWKANEETFDPGARPRGSRPVRPLEEAAAGDASTTPSFFRLPVLSGRVAFLIDCSGSMRDAAVGEDAKGATKMDVARAELERTLAGLDGKVRFDVYLYRYPSEFPPRPKMTRAFGKLQACTPARAKGAVAWLAGQEGKGWGAFYDALDALLAEKEVDTVFFLSDGRPSRGRFDRDFRLISELEARNRFRQLVVHTVLVGRQKADREFLENLAASTGGRFSDATRSDR